MPSLLRMAVVIVFVGFGHRFSKSSSMQEGITLKEAQQSSIDPDLIDLLYSQDRDSIWIAC
ncbi:MAG: hypothetical protein R3D25_03030 [Geminicoccaceae bacterium]